jgi:hypothetical protein
MTNWQDGFMDMTRCLIFPRGNDTSIIGGDYADSNTWRNSAPGFM